MRDLSQEHSEGSEVAVAKESNRRARQCQGIIRVRLLWEEFFRNVQRHGLERALLDIATRAINRVIFFRILRCVHIEVVDPAYLRVSDRYRCGFLNEGTLLEYSQREEFELSDFVPKVLAKGDCCFGIQDGNVLANYGWYSNTPTDVYDHLRLNFDRKYIYVYKGFTHPQYRGQRLLAIGLTMALKEYVDRGFRGLISVVEANNYDSLKAVYRMGYLHCGDIYLARIFGRYLIQATLGCKLYGVSLEAHEPRPTGPNFPAPHPSRAGLSSSSPESPSTRQPGREL